MSPDTLVHAAEHVMPLQAAQQSQISKRAYVMIIFNPYLQAPDHCQEGFAFFVIERAFACLFKLVLVMKKPLRRTWTPTLAHCLAIS